MTRKRWEEKEKRREASRKRDSRAKNDFTVSRHLSQTTIRREGDALDRGSSCLSEELEP